MAAPYAEQRILEPKEFLSGPGNPKSLENVITESLPDGAACFVIDVGDWFVLDKTSTAPVFPPEVIAAASGGRWLQLAALGKMLSFDTVVEFRAHPPLANDTVFYISGIGLYVYRASQGANQPDDGRFLLKPNAIALNQPGRAYEFVLSDLASPIVETPISSSSGTVSLVTNGKNPVGPSLPFPVPESSVTRLKFEALFSANGGQKVWIGSLLASVTRQGSGTPEVSSQSFGAGNALTNTAWNPEFVQVGNTIELQVTADPDLVIVPRGKFSITSKDTSQDPTTSQLAIARAAVLAAQPDALYYSDVQVLPPGLIYGDAVEGWNDQSGNAHDLTFPATRRPEYRLTGAQVPYLEMIAANTVFSVAAGAAYATGDRTIRFTVDMLAAGVFSILLSRTSEVIAVHAGAGFNTDGSNIVCGFGGAYHSLGAALNGLHDYEIRINQVALTAQLWIDGVAAGPPVAFDVIGTPTTPMIIGYNGAQAPKAVSLYGVCIQDGIGTAQEMQDWIDQSVIAWPR